ncbi:putative transcription factor WD40-like family [Helianthus anomalus]
MIARYFPFGGDVYSFFFWFLNALHNIQQVKIWYTKQETSVVNIDMKANICSVKYNPGSSYHVAVSFYTFKSLSVCIRSFAYWHFAGGFCIRYYDLRNISQQSHRFSGHRKAVSYVKCISDSELASASTDSTLHLWDVKENVRTFRGHTNEKNFVGLSVNNEYIACRSESNEVFVIDMIRLNLSRPAAWRRLSSETNEGEEEAGSYFISTVCWKSDSPTMLTANSEGTIKVLVLAAA